MMWTRGSRTRAYIQGRCVSYEGSSAALPKGGFVLNPSRLSSLFVVLLASAVLAGCHHALFQSPEVLEPGEHAIGVGAAGSAVLEPAVLPHEIDLFYRMGIDGNTDVGARLTYSLHTIVDEWHGFLHEYENPLTIAVDGKHCLRAGPLLMAGDLGLSWTPGAGLLVGIHPTVMVGTSWLYAGARVSVYRHGAWWRWPEGLPSFTVGAKLGKRLYVMPELTFGWVPWYSRGEYAAKGNPELVFGLAFQYRFGRLAYFDEGSGVPGLTP